MAYEKLGQVEFVEFIEFGVGTADGRRWTQIGTPPKWRCGAMLFAEFGGRAERRSAPDGSRTEHFEMGVDLEPYLHFE